MKAIALVVSIGMLVPAGFVPYVVAQPACRIERVTYRVQGLQIVSWIMKPARDGRFPVVVWSHGARYAFSQVPVINENTPCHPFVVSRGWMLFFAVARGYAGSEGPRPAPTLGRDLIAFLHQRADDLNAGVEWLRTRPDVNPACIINMGWSQGGVVTLLASGEQPLVYRATVVQAPGAAAGVNSTVGMDEMIRAGKNIPTPILVQSNTADEDVFVEGTRVLVRELQRWGRSVEYKEYTYPPRLHFLFEISEHPGFPYRPELFQIWGPDATGFMERAFAGCAK